MSPIGWKTAPKKATPPVVTTLQVEEVNNALAGLSLRIAQLESDNVLIRQELERQSNDGK